MNPKPEPKAPRRVWIVRIFGTQLWCSPICCSEKAALNHIERERKRGRDGYYIGPYAAPRKRTTSPQTGSK